MVGVHPDDRSHLKIMHPDGSARRLTRLPFGLNCSAAVLHHVIHHHLAICADRPLVNQVAAGMYEDDLVTGADSAHEILALRHSPESLFQEAGMTLHKFATSCPGESPTSISDKGTASSVLGLEWLLSDDRIAVTLLPHFDQRIRSKRDLMSAAARTFDPPRPCHSVVGEIPLAPTRHLDQANRIR